MEAIIGDKIDQENFLDLVNISKTITDYHLDEDQAMNEEIAIDEDEE